MNICFVIVTFQPDKTKLDKLVASFKGWQVIVVDNTKNNRGYAGGANVGIRQALEQGYEWLVLVNDDVTITKKALKSFLDIVKTSKPAIIGPYAAGIDKKRWTTILPSKNMGYIDLAFAAVHRDIFRTVGEFYEPYFIYYEDIDLCIRAKRAGFSLRWNPNDEIQHEGSKVMGKGSFLQTYYAARNHLLFVERLAPPYVKFYEFIRLPKTLFEHIYKKEWGALLGVFHYLIHRFGKLK